PLRGERTGVANAVARIFAGVAAWGTGGAVVLMVVGLRRSPPPRGHRSPRPPAPAPARRSRRRDGALRHRPLGKKGSRASPAVPPTRGRPPRRFRSGRLGRILPARIPRCERECLASDPFFGLHVGQRFLQLRTFGLGGPEEVGHPDRLTGFGR